MNTLHGVFPILPTPFDASGSIDRKSLVRLIEYVSQKGVHGVSILGFLGEAHKLSSAERSEVIRTVLDARPPGLLVYVGVRAYGAAGAIEMGQAARVLGADGLFLAPIAVQGGNAQVEFYEHVAREVGLPVLIHDFPESFGITIPVDTVRRIAESHDNIVGIKLEEKPVLPKLSAILEQIPDFRVFGGLGGMFCLEELGRGAAGIMTGFAFPHILVDIYTAFRAGDHARATKTFDQYATLLRYEFQPKIGIAFRKHTYVGRGVFSTAHVRAPAPALDDRSREELEGIIHRLGLDNE